MSVPVYQHLLIVMKKYLLHLQEPAIKVTVVSKDFKG